jgi:hypothetical protein
MADRPYNILFLCTGNSARYRRDLYIFFTVDKCAASDCPTSGGGNLRFCLWALADWCISKATVNTAMQSTARAMLVAMSFCFRLKSAHAAIIRTAKPSRRELYRAARRQAVTLLAQRSKNARLSSNQITFRRERRTVFGGGKRQHRTVLRQSWGLHRRSIDVTDARSMRWKSAATSTPIDAATAPTNATLSRCSSGIH